MLDVILVWHVYHLHLLFLEGLTPQGCEFYFFKPTKSIANLGPILDGIINSFKHNQYSNSITSKINNNM